MACTRKQAGSEQTSGLPVLLNAAQRCGVGYLPTHALDAAVKRFFTSPREPPFLPSNSMPTHAAWLLVLGAHRPVGVTLDLSALDHTRPLPMIVYHLSFFFFVASAATACV